MSNKKSEEITKMALFNILNELNFDERKKKVEELFLVLDAAEDIQLMLDNNIEEGEAENE